MTWHLKNHALEKKLNELVGKNRFTEALNRECVCIENKKIIVVKFGENTGHVKGSFRCYFEKAELTNIGYDPHDWNNFPEITPPYDVMMRIDFENFSMGFKAFYKHFEDSDCWCYPDGVLMPKAYSDDVKRYRPWED